MSRWFFRVMTVLFLSAGMAAMAAPPPKYSPPQVDRKAQEAIRSQAQKSLCPKGLPWLQGTWRFVGHSRVVGFSDVMTFNGSHYREHIEGGASHRREIGDLAGQYACVANNRVLLRIDKATPEGVFGNRSGDDYPCDWRRQPAKKGALERMLLICYVEWDLRSAKALDLEFERVPKAASPRD